MLQLSTYIFWHKLFSSWNITQLIDSSEFVNPAIERTLMRPLKCFEFFSLHFMKSYQYQPIDEIGIKCQYYFTFRQFLSSSLVCHEDGHVDYKQKHGREATCVCFWKNLFDWQARRQNGYNACLQTLQNSSAEKSRGLWIWDEQLPDEEQHGSYLSNKIRSSLRSNPFAAGTSSIPS